MTFKNNGAPLLYDIKLCASFQSHWWIQTSVTVPKRSIWAKSAIFYPVWPWNFDGWPSKTTEHLFYAASSFVHHFIVISELKLGVTVWKSPIGQNWWFFFVLYDLEIWRMTLKNNRAPLLSNIKLCAPIHHHMWIQTGVTVRKWPSWVLTSVTLTVDSWKFHDDTMTGTLWKRCNKGTDGRMDRQTDRSVLRAA